MYIIHSSIYILTTIEVGASKRAKKTSTDPTKVLHSREIQYGNMLLLLDIVMSPDAV